MFVNARKVGQAIVVGNVRIVLVKIKGRNEVLIGVEAPQDVLVLREEIGPPTERRADPPQAAPPRPHGRTAADRRLEGRRRRIGI